MEWVHFVWWEKNIERGWFSLVTSKVFLSGKFFGPWFKNLNIKETLIVKFNLEGPRQQVFQNSEKGVKGTIWKLKGG